MKRKSSSSVSRREFIALTSTLAATVATGFPASAKVKSTKKKAAAPKSGKPNILMIFTDQERHFQRLPTTFPLPGHQKLAQRGTYFSQHHVSATMCTSSRSVMFTGLQTADTGLFDNTDAPYVNALPKSIPTLGGLLRKAGYYTAYKGKWHLSRDFEGASCTPQQGAVMDAYGFSDFSSPGDQAAHDNGGFHSDPVIGASAISWLRNQGSALSADGKPWSLTVSLVNPHDIMYFNADAPGENVQDTGKLLMHAARAPEYKLYQNDWRQPLPSSLRQPVDQAGRPSAHAEYNKAWGYCLGHIPLEAANWQRFTNFYLNSLWSVDAQLNAILTELENLGLAENTIVVFTADHGEMGGHHGLRGKGPFAYKESLHVPFYVTHPDVKGGSQCRALTSHIDIVPTLLGLAGVTPTQAAEYAGRSLPGKDFSAVVGNPGAAGVHAVRDKALFTYSGIATNDAEMIRIIAEAKARGENPKDAIKKSGYKPNLKNRGSLRTVFDGRYKFTRYFSPMERNSPKTITDLFAHNDVELFDLQTDPNEMINLAAKPDANKDLILTMSAKLEKAIADEIGVDNGREMPNFPGIDWSLDEFDL